MKLSGQMKNILLAMFKADRDPTSSVGQVIARHARLHGAPGLDAKDLARLLKGEETFYVEGKYIKGTVVQSCWRSLKKLLEYGLIWVIQKKSPGRHGYLYGLTPKGRAEAEKIWAESSMFIEEHGKLI